MVIQGRELARTADTTLAIETQALCKIYTQRKGPSMMSVDHLNLSIPQGLFFGLLGPNGAGKTTNIKMLCGLIIPSSGRVLLHGRIATEDRAATMRQIGAVLEGTRNVYWRLSPWQNLMYFGRLKGCPEKDIRRRAEPLLRELDLWPRRNDPVGQFSRGMQQKVAIACVLVADPTIVLLDEPTLGLDVLSARTVKDWVRKLAHEQGKTVIITSHELDMVQEVCDRVAILRRGQLVVDKPMTDLLALFREEHYEIRLGAHLTAQQADTFEELTILHCEDNTVLSGAIADQETLYRLLAQVRRMDLPLISVKRVEPNLEEVFLSLTNATAERIEQ
jgi:ABC-2 type transport system ATP-binding protein